MLRVYVPDEALKKRMQEKQSKAHAGDCGVDLFCAQIKNNVEKPGGLKPYQLTIHTGVHVAAYDDHGRPTGCLLYPRSSISKTCFTLANSVGIIDAGYRGEVLGKVNVNYEMAKRPSCNASIDKNTRLLQVCLPTLRPPRVEFVSSMEELGKPIDTRGTGGFGSTNVLETSNPIENSTHSRSVSRRGRGKGRAGRQVVSKPKVEKDSSSEDKS